MLTHAVWLLRLNTSSFPLCLNKGYAFFPMKCFSEAFIIFVVL